MLSSSHYFPHRRDLSVFFRYVWQYLIYSRAKRLFVSAVFWLINLFGSIYIIYCWNIHGRRTCRHPPKVLPNGAIIVSGSRTLRKINSFQLSVNAMQPKPMSFKAYKHDICGSLKRNIWHNRHSLSYLDTANFPSTRLCSTLPPAASILQQNDGRDARESWHLGFGGFSFVDRFGTSLCYASSFCTVVLSDDKK